jgi:hypothetical protein
MPWATAVIGQAALSETSAMRVQLIGLTGSLNYRQRFEKRIEICPCCTVTYAEPYRSPHWANLDLPWLIKAGAVSSPRLRSPNPSLQWRGWPDRRCGKTAAAVCGCRRGLDRRPADLRMAGQH